MSHCLHCEKSEAAFAELVVYDEFFQVSRGTINTGVCADHMNLDPQSSYDAPIERYRERFEAIVQMHEKMFPPEKSGRTLPLKYGIRYHALDSLVGQDIRARRIGIEDPNKASVHNPLKKLPIERVSTEDFLDAFGFYVPPKGKIFG